LRGKQIVKRPNGVNKYDRSLKKSGDFKIALKFVLGEVADPKATPSPKSTPSSSPAHLAKVALHTVTGD
jgi:hypothetical protein